MATRKKVAVVKKSTGTPLRVLSARDLRISRTLTPIPLPDLGGIVYKRELPASVIISRPTMTDTADLVQQQNTVAWFICKSIVDENGNQIFPDDEADTLRDTLNVSVYATLALAVTGTSGVPGTAGLIVDSKEKGGALPNGSTPIPS